MQYLTFWNLPVMLYFISITLPIFTHYGTPEAVQLKIITLNIKDRLLLQSTALSRKNSQAMCQPKEARVMTMPFLELAE
jgi:hypothetical protein